MLYAIEHNKAGRNFQAETDWRRLFSTSEDSLTSSVFSLLFYLPVELFWSILSKACYTPLPANSSPLEHFEFWPHWDCNQTHNTKFVEPDLFARFRDTDLIIEAKRYDDNQQSKHQWQSELQAYMNEENKNEILNSRKVIFLAIGGISNENEDLITVGERAFPVIKCRWRRLLQEIQRHLYLLEKSTKLLSNVDASIIILKDLILAFRLHGFSTGVWFESMKLSSQKTKKQSIGLLQEKSFKIDPINWGLLKGYKINAISITYLLHEKPY